MPRLALNSLFAFASASLLLGLSGCSGGSDNSPSDVSALGDVTTTATDGSTNTAPIVDSVTFAVQQDNAHLIMLDAIDYENDALSWTLVAEPENGNITGQLPLMMYTPNSGYQGPDHFQVSVSDGQLSSAVTNINLVVSSQTESPVPRSQTLSMVKDTSLPITLLVDGTIGRDVFYILKTFPEHGRLSGEIPHLEYTPDAGFEGHDQFLFAIGDSQSLSPAATIDISVVYPTQRVGDTGVIWGAEYPSGNNIQCIGETVRQQDCSMGRDAQAFAASGKTGFEFTKLDENGAALPDTATDWFCVRDEVSGLIWETKETSDNAKGSQGLRDPDDIFTWNETDPSLNGGGSGYDNTIRNCSDYNSALSASYCNTEALVDRANVTQMCGFSDWRLPSRQELETLIDLSGGTPVIDQDFFPETQSGYYWSSTPSQYNARLAWAVNFATGEHGLPYRNGAYSIRLVRETP